MKLDINKIINTLKDRFVIGMTVGVIILVIFFMVGIEGQWSAIEESQGKLKREESALQQIINTGTANPTEQTIAAYREHKQKLEEEYQKCLRYYEQANEVLKPKWFEGAAPDTNSGGIPPEGTFKTAYNKAHEQQLIAPLEANKITIMTREGVVADTDKAKKETLGFEELKDRRNAEALQKRFWVRKKIVEALIAARIQQCGPLTAKESATREQFTDDFGYYLIPFEVTVFIPYKNVGQLVYYLEDASKGGPFLTIQQVKITRETQQGKEIEEEFHSTTEKPQYAPPQENFMVKVVIAGNVYDFGPKKK